MQSPFASLRDLAREKILFQMENAQALRQSHAPLLRPAA